MEFKLNTNDVQDRPLHKVKFVRYTPQSLTGINTPNADSLISCPKQSAYISLKDSYLLAKVSVTKNDGTLLADTNHHNLINLGGAALFTDASLTTHSSKHLERVSHVHIASLIYKLLRHKEPNINLNYSKTRTDRESRLLKDTTKIGTIYIKIPLSDIFGFAEYQNKITYGLGYDLTLRRNNNNNVILKNATEDEVMVEIKSLSWYIPHYTPSIENTTLVMEQMLKKEPTTMSYIERKSYRHNVNQDEYWSATLGVESGIEIPIYVIVAFQKSERNNNQSQDNSLFDTLPIQSATCYVGDERYPDYDIITDYEENNYWQAYDEIQTYFREFIGEPLLEPPISFNEFKAKYNFYVFDLRHQKNHISAQSIKVDFNFKTGEDVKGENYIAYFLVLSNKRISISSDGNQMHDIT